MITATENKVVVKVNYISTDAVTTVRKVLANENGSSIDISELVTIKGEVISLPKKISNTLEFKGFTTEDIYEGDIAIFSWLVVGDMKHTELEYPILKNLIPYKGQKIFNADIRLIFGVIRGGDIFMVNGYVMLEDFEESKIIVAQHHRRVKRAQVSKVLYIGNAKEGEKKIDVEPGDKVYFNPFKVQRYRIADKKFCILPQHHILGKQILD